MLKPFHVLRTRWAGRSLNLTARHRDGAQARRIALVDECLADPPQVHVAVESGQAPGGVWHSPRPLYRFMAEHCTANARTLETGLGISTLLFARWGCIHTCVVDKQGEVDRFLAYCRAHEIDSSKLTFRVGRSDLVLQKLQCPPLDLVLIDGCHGFPAAVLDWYFGAAYLRWGGVLVLDDTALPSVRLGLLEYLHRDPRWEQLVEDPTWEAFVRRSAGPLAEEWSTQPFLAV